MLQVLAFFYTWNIQAEPQLQESVYMCMWVYVVVKHWVV